MLPIKSFVTLMAIVVLLTGCANWGLLRKPELCIVADPAVVIPEGASYTWGAQQFRLPTDMQVDVAEVEARIRGAIERELEARGYHAAESDGALLISFAAGVDTDLDPSRLDATYAETFKQPVAPGISQATAGYTRGALMIDVLEAHSGKLLWRGIIRGGLETETSPERKEARVRKAVALLLEQFPKPRT